MYDLSHKQDGSLNLYGSQDEAIQNVKLGQNIKYLVGFPLQNPVPKVTKIFYNGDLICSGPDDQNSVTTFYLEHTMKTSVVSHGSPESCTNCQNKVKTSRTIFDSFEDLFESEVFSSSPTSEAQGPEIEGSSFKNIFRRILTEGSITPSSTTLKPKTHIER